MDYDGTVFDTQVIEYGSPAVEPDNPFKPSDESNAYAFMYWDANFDSIVSDTIINPVFNAVPLSTEYVVNFYNAFGDIISSQNIVHGEDAIAPITNPEKMSDSQYDYTFTGWDTDFTSVNQDLDILPLFDKILRTYTVNFYDHDGVTILDTQTIDFGAAATAPTAPQKPDDAEWSYTFIGWDSNFNQISDDLDVYPVYIKTSLSVFDRADLVDMVNLMFEDPDNVETIITMLTGMFSAVSEEALYHDLSIVNQMMDELNNISSASDIQDMFTAIQALGFNKDKIISIFYGFVLIQLNDDIAKMQEEITYKQAEIEDEEEMIDNYEGDLDDINNVVSDYCALQTGLESACYQYFLDAVNAYILEIEYYNSFDFDVPDEFDYDDYNQLEDLLDDYYYVLIYSDDPLVIQAALDDYNDFVDTLTTEEMAMYQPHLTKFADVIEAVYIFDSGDYSNLDVLDHTDNEFIINELNRLLGGYYSDYESYGYLDVLDGVDYSEWRILELTWDIQDLQRRIDNNQLMLDYWSSAAGAIAAEALIGTAYDALEAMMMQLDEETYEFVKDFINMMNMLDSYNDSYYIPYNPFDMISEVINEDNILMISGKLSTMITTLMSTMDITDFSNIETFIIGYVTAMLEDKGLDSTSILLYTNNLNTAIDLYTTYFISVVDEITSFLDSMDLDKAEVISNLIFMDKHIDASNIDFAIKLAQSVETLIGDDSFDISTIMEYMARIYFDVKNEFIVDELEVAEVQTAVGYFIDDLLDLVSDISDLNPTYVTPADVEDIMELYGRLFAIQKWFDQGFETFDNPIIVYQDWYLINLLYMMGEYDTDEAIAKYSTVFGIVEEDELFYNMVSIFQYVSGIMSFEGFADIQYWVANLESFGFTQSELIGYLLEVLDINSDFMILGDDDYQDDLKYYNNQIINYETQAAIWQGYLDLIDASIADEIALLSPELQDDAELYWSYYILYQQSFLDVWYAEQDLDYDFSTTEVTDIIEVVNNYVDELYSVDQTDLAMYLAAYQDLLDLYSDSEEAQEIITNYEALVEIYVNLETTNFSPLYSLLSINAAYDDFMILADNNINDYLYKLDRRDGYLQLVDDYEGSLYYLYRSLWVEYLILDLMDDPILKDNTGLVIGYLLDEVQNMITSMPSNSFTMIEDLLKFLRQKFEISVYADLTPEPVMPFDLTPVNIYQMSQEISMLLKLRGDTLTPEEITVIEQMITDCITLYVNRYEVVDPGDEADYIQLMSTLILKYIGFADATLTEVTNFLDGLTLEKVQSIMDFSMMIKEEQSNIFVTVILVSQFIDSLIDIDDVDIILIVDMLNEMYFDIDKGPDGDPADLLLLQEAWGEFISDTFDLIGNVALMDPENVNLADFETIYGLFMRVEFLFGLFEDIQYGEFTPEIIFSVPDFTFDVEDLENLMFDMFEDIDEFTVDARIDELLEIFDLPEDGQEDLFYIIMSAASMMQNLGEIHSVNDVINIYNSIISLGFTNADLASYLVNAFMIYVYPELPNMYDSTQLEIDLVGYGNAIDFYNTRIQEIQGFITDEINAITDPSAQAAALDLWADYAEYYEKYAEYTYYLDYVYSYQEMFDYDTYDDLIWYVDNEMWISVQYFYPDLSSEQYDMYEHLIGLYMQKEMLYDLIFEDYVYFYSNYSWVETTYQQAYETYLIDYILYITFSDPNNYYLSNLYSRVMADNYEQTLDDLNRVQSSAEMLQTLEIFLADELNVTLSKDMLEIILNELISLTGGTNIDTIDFIISMMGRDPGEFDMEEVALEINNIGSMMIDMFSEVDLDDELTIVVFISNMIIANVQLQAIVDPLEEAALIDALLDIVDAYYLDVMDIPSIIGTYLQTVTETDLLSLLDQIALMNSIPTGDEDNDNYIRAIATANIIAILVDNGDLDLETLQMTILGIVYGVNEAYNGTLAETFTDVIDNSAGKIVAVLINAFAIMDIDPFDYDSTDIAAIELFRLATTDLSEYIGPLFDLEFPVAIPEE